MLYNFFFSSCSSFRSCHLYKCSPLAPRVRLTRCKRAVSWRKHSDLRNRTRVPAAAVAARLGYNLHPHHLLIIAPLFSPTPSSMMFVLFVLSVARLPLYFLCDLCVLCGELFLYFVDHSAPLTGRMPVLLSIIL